MRKRGRKELKERKNKEGRRAWRTGWKSTCRRREEREKEKDKRG